MSAAREVFTEQGYDGATVRTIAKRAGVDAAMVNHWFGGKEGLFDHSVLQLPIAPNILLARLLDGDPADFGRHMARTFLTVWDERGGGLFAALIRSVAGHERAAHALREFFLNQVFEQLTTQIATDNREFRATLVASQMIGMGMIRYVAKFEPLAGADIETVVNAVGPNLQRYLTGPIN